MYARRHCSRPTRTGRQRAYCLFLETLENRLAPAGLTIGPTLVAPPAITFDATSGTLSILGEAGALVAATADGGIAVTVHGQLYSSDANAVSFDAALINARAATLRGIHFGDGGTADALTLGNLQTTGNLTINADGGVTLGGKLGIAGQLLVTAASLTVEATVSAEALSLTSAGLLDIASGGSLTAQASDNGGWLAAAANSFVNVGAVRADGTNGGNITINASNYLNAGTLSAQGTGGVGGDVRVGFTASYIDTAAAQTTACSSAGSGGWVTIDGGSSGRLFSSGHFDATGTNGGAIDLFGKDLELVAATVDASGAAGRGGALRVGGGYQGQDPTAVNAQTVDVTATTSLRADGTAAGGRIITWSEVSTTFAGSVSAQGAGGGFIEISAHGQLTYGGQADAGAGGTLLLDPKNLVISAAPAGVFPQFNLVNPEMAGTFGTQVLTLSTGNIVVTDPTAITYVGAVYLFNGQTGALLSMLTGTTGGASGDQVGSGGVKALTNGNYVVDSTDWNGARGAATWGSGTTGVSGVVSASNSLVGTNASDDVGYGVTALTNGNYVVGSPDWNGYRGAATWGSGTAGVSGLVSASNSLVGTNANDSVGTGGVTALTNGNYVVDSKYWNGARGAATWGSGTAGVSGLVSASNSLVGTNANDYVGSGGVTALTNGNYVVGSPNWNGGLGAATWGSGTTGVSGVVSASNSLVGTNANDSVGTGVTALTNGNYVVESYEWNGARGAATWGSGTAGVSGVVSASNSLVGTNANDYVGSGGVTALTNGNYVVDSPDWNGYRGAATWGSGTAGVSGVVSASNSLVGTNANDYVGSGGVTALTNGNYVVGSTNWNGYRGAATWGSGTAGVSGVVSASNSLVGTNANDSVGTGVTALTNGNYVVESYEWNGARGAATWGSGTAGVSGLVSASNSLVGTNANDYVGSGGVTALTNGNYVVGSTNWNGARGAATWGSGTAGVSGVVSASNSLVGTNANDSVGTGVKALTNGNYVVGSPNWIGGLGAATWGDGSTGTTLDGLNTIDAQNSLEGATANAGLGYIQPGAIPGSFLAAFTTENGGVVTVGFTDPNQISNTLDQGQTLTVTPAFLQRSLNAGTSVTLQASNNITLNSPLSATGTASLTLQAGTSLALNANLTLGGSLALSAPTITASANFTLQAGASISLSGSLNAPSGSPLLHAPSVTLQGTPGNDTFVYNAAAANPLSLNGVAYSLAATVTSIHFVGNGGSDNATLTGQGNDSAALLPTDVSLTSNGITVDAANCASVTVNAGGANSTANFGLTATGADTYKGTSTFSEAVGAGYNNTAVGFSHAHGFAGSNTHATAILATSAGADEFGGVPAYSFVSGPNDSYDSYAIGFANVDGYSGGTDSIAYLGMSSGADTFGGVPAYSFVSGTGYTIYAVGFHQVQAYAGSATAVAYLGLSANANDFYYGSPTYSEVTGAGGTGYVIYALGFHRVQAYAGGGSNQIAYLQQLSGSDPYVNYGGAVESSGTGYDNVAIGFPSAEVVRLT